MGTYYHADINDLLKGGSDDADELVGQPYRKRMRGDRPMTVCIAVICDQTYPSLGRIVLVSDRQFTVGDHFTYEPFQRKQVRVNDHIVALFSGTGPELEEVYQRAQAADWPFTRDVRAAAEDFATAFATYRREQAVKSLLEPLGLTLDSLTHDSSLSENLVRSLVRELQRWTLGDEFIVAGMDATGKPHLYTVSDPGEVAPAALLGFVATGSGTDHASAVFMRYKYNRSWSVATAIYLAYAAKKAAEVDPYVGFDTDVWIIGPDDSGGGPLPAELLETLDNLYRESQASDIRMANDATQKFNQSIQEYLLKTTPAEPAEQQGGTEGASSSYAGELPADSGEGEPSEC